MPWANSFLRQVEEYCGTEFPSIRSACELSETKLEELSRVVQDKLPEGASFVVFGSLARKEFTSGSDLDWSLLVDGRTDPGHRAVVQAIKRSLNESGHFKNPSPAGAFGSMFFGHELVHFIGGNEDSNANLTRRQLLLLESAETNPHFEISPRARVIRAVLGRYFEEETYFPGKSFFPRFFLNDVVRYWRTIAVDYAAKNTERAGDGWALRNMKLRFSRKLLYIAGLLLTYETTLFPATELILTQDEARSENQCGLKLELSGIESCLTALQLTPLELLARACLMSNTSREDATGIFSSYAEFLNILNSEEKRSILNTLTFQTATTDRFFQTIRDLSHQFQDRLSNIFMNPENTIGELTLRYGIF